MTTLTILLIFFGCFALYNTSKKVVLQQRSNIEIWLQNHTKSSKIIGFLLLALGFVFAIAYFGTTSGILMWLFIVSSVFSLLIILYPLQKINYKHVWVFFVFSFLIECIF